MRILIGTSEIGGLIPVYKKGFESLGHEVTTVITHRNRFYENSRYDVYLHQNKLLSDIQRLEFRVNTFFSRDVQDLLHWSRAKRLIDDHDIFVFLWGGTSLLSRHKDYPMIKAKNKKIVSIFVGSDIRYMPVFNKQYSVKGELGDIQANDSLIDKLENLRMGELYADMVYSVPDQSGLSVRPYQHFQIPLDLSKFKFVVPARNIPKVVHIPSNPEMKGTAVLSAVLDTLQRLGVPFKWQCLTNIPHSRVIDELANADILVDEIVAHGPGILSLEAMASGCAVATKHLADSPDFFRPPLVNINEDNCLENLKTLILNRELRLKLAHDGRKYVEANNDCTKISACILSDLESPPNLSQHYPHFIFKNSSILHGKKIPNRIIEMTAKITEKHGIPQDSDLNELKRNGLVPDTFASKMRWPVSIETVAA